MASMELASVVKSNVWLLDKKIMQVRSRLTEELAGMSSRCDEMMLAVNRGESASISVGMEFATSQLSTINRLSRDLDELHVQRGIYLGLAEVCHEPAAS